jgi:hypothetical protein
VDRGREERRYALELSEGEVERYWLMAERYAGFRAAREAMVTAGVATEDDVRRWERAFQELEAAPVRPTFFAPFFTALGRRPR